MADLNGGIEIHPGPRGHSITGFRLSDDGTIAYPQTDKPGELNGVLLPRGPKGVKGDNGDPGEARIRIDTTVGHRVMMWDTATAGENQLFGDTGVWDIGGGVLVHRHNNTVTTTATDPTTLPDGFRPALNSAAAGKCYTTLELWPATVTGTIISPPDTGRGLEGYQAALAQGFPGTAEEWIHMVYGVLPTDGTPGQWLQWGSIGPMWGNLPLIGPGPWVNITLTSNWRPYTGSVVRARNNNGTIEMIGDVTYQGALMEVGIWGEDFTHIGTLPPGMAPDAHYDMPTRTFKGLLGDAGTPVLARIDVNKQGQIYLGAFDLGGGNTTLPIRAGITHVSLGALPSFPLRNSSQGG